MGRAAPEFSDFRRSNCNAFDLDDLDFGGLIVSPDWQEAADRMGRAGLNSQAILARLVGGEDCAAPKVHATFGLHSPEQPTVQTPR